MEKRPSARSNNPSRPSNNAIAVTSNMNGYPTRKVWRVTGMARIKAATASTTAMLKMLEPTMLP